VGDRVGFRITPEGAAVEELLPRRNSLTRPAVRKRDDTQTIAANIDRMIIVGSMKDPPLKTGLIDRFLVAAAAEEFEAVICINKTDLIETESEAALLENATALYTGLGYRTIPTSAVEGKGVETLREEMRSGVSLIVGHSGVGKSTLINRIDPRQKLKTGEISARQRKGQHTTTMVSLLRLSGGGFVVDTPGIREFGIKDLRSADIGHFFPEIASRLPECQYGDCTHRHEPGCAVLEALEGGGISKGRYKSYLGILEELEK
jgi:ribosome biogenesis GTPase